MTPFSIFWRRAAAGLVLSIVLLGACASGGRTTRIGDLLADPGQYDGETVRVRGRVTQSVGVLGYGGYRIEDGTGTMNVVTTRGGAPSEGARVGVVGTFRAVYTFGSSTGAAIMERDRFRP